jgi:phage terminase small subunit
MPGNARSGRKRKPASLHRLEGTRPHYTPDARAPGTPGAPVMPAHVAADPVAAAHWARLVDELLPLDLLLPTYGEALAALACSCADVERGREQLAGMHHAFVIVEEFPDSQGTLRRRVRANPLRRELARAERELRAWCVEFGKTPSSKVAPARDPAEDDVEAFLRSRPTLVPFPPRPRRSRQTGTDP